MPAPQAAMMKQLARLKFSQNNLRVPDGWKQPQGDPDAKHYNDAFAPGEKMTMPDPTVPPLFLPHTSNKYHTDTQKMLTSKIGGFIDGVCDAICQAWSQWQLGASLIGVLINGPIATLGQVVGPPIGPMILGTAPKSTPQLAKYSNAIANTINTAWSAYTATIKVPGLPWYPAFTAFPGPLAPPMPNLPVPVIALTQVTTPVSAATMKPLMIAALGDPKAMYHQQIFDAICDAFEKCFTIWQASTMVTNVMGKGPIPTFAPPVVPAGPVVMGEGSMIPGGFA
ncbi:MAG TPA: hypothetical protein VFQ53_11650 [Kofleriaceae bacterium]|nr:hypothetical protein [Kofleriaceae bacterium]